MNIINESTFRSALKSGINLFLGSGFSVLAANADNKTMPIGNGLTLELGEAFDLKDVEHATLPQICTIIGSTNKNGLNEFLRHRFHVTKFDKLYRSIGSINAKSIITTNIDDLVVQIFDRHLTKYINDITIRGASHGGREAVDFAPLHGSVSHEADDFVFSPIEIASAFSDDSDRWHFLTNRIQESPTLFWGYSLGDAGVLQALNPRTIGGRSHNEKWIVLREPSKTEVQYFEALNFSIIIADTRELLGYIKDLGLSKATLPTPASRSTHTLFPEESVPDIGHVPVRPLVEYFKGYPPNWNDIFSGRIPKTSHYSKVVNTVNSSKNAIVIGIPASGKTTLLMQVAAGVEYNGHKLVCGPLTPEKVSLIFRKLKGDRALIFVDDYTDDVESFKLLVEADNVQAVGFDRNHNYQITSHIIDSGKLDLLEITDLHDRDIQTIYDHIPPELRAQKLRRPATEGETTPSVFEVIETNSGGPTLSGRFASLLSQLESNDQISHDLLVMCCYVHYCRTSVSYDMISAFLREDVQSYNDVTDMVKGLGTLLAESSGVLVDADQDYYSPRSTLVSEAIFRQVAPFAFKRMLLKFHRNVSSIRICRFDVFRRRAFDSELAFKAFPNWRDGLDFYKMVALRDGSPYIKQQGAVYLSKKRQYQEAFRWIDEALAQSKNNIFSIKNSHAIIMFHANISQNPEDSTVRETLIKSMEILQSCYYADKRKIYHAVSYGQQALQFADVYMDDNVALDQLVKAEQWLIDEKRRSPWHRDIKSLHRKVNATLDSFQRR